MSPNDVLTLVGDLTVREVPDAFRRIEGHLPARIEMSEVEQTDSSALAFLLECHARARAAGQVLEVSNPPDSLRVIARLTDVAGLVGFNDNDDNGEHHT